MKPKQNNLYECRVCHQEFTIFEDAQAHIKTVHLIHLMCPYCDKIFPDMLELTMHKNMHIQIAIENARQQNRPNVQASNGKGKQEADGEQLSASSKESDEVGAPVVHCNLQSMLSKPKNLQNNIFSDHTCQPEEGNTNECKFKKGEEVSLRFSKEMCDDPLEVLSEAAFNIVKFKDASAVKTQLVPEQEASSGFCNDCDISIPVEEDQHVKIPEDRKPHGDVTLIKRWSQIRYLTPKLAEHKCNSCKKKFLTTKERKSHVKEVYARDINCLLCSKTFSTLSQFIQHSIVHLNNYLSASFTEEFQNGDIGQDSSEEFKKVSSPKEKVSIISPQLWQDDSSEFPKPSIFRCRLCTEVFFSLEVIRCHIKQVHIDGLLCFLCNLKFTNIKSICGHAQKYHGVILKSGATLPDEPSHSCALSPLTSKNEGSMSAAFGCQLYTDTVIPTEESNCSFPMSSSLNEENDSSLDTLSTDDSKGNIGAAIECDLHNDDHIPIADCKCSRQISPSLCEINYTSVDVVKAVSNEGSIGTVVGCKSDSGVQMPREEGKCDQCGLCFNSGSSLLFHKRTHKKVLYKCGVCNFSSLSKECVITHLHKEGHSFQCFLYN